MLWQGGHNSKKYHLVDWDTVCIPKDQGGLGVLDLNSMNKCLLSKWIWKIENSDGLWQKILKEKYIKGKPLISIRKKQSDSHFWKGILNVKDMFYKFCRKKVGNGSSTSFWENMWCGDFTVADKFPRLFNLALNKEISVDKVLSSDFNALSFRRRIVGDLGNMFEALKSLCCQTTLTVDDDRVHWTLGKKGFTVNSLYKMNRSNSMLVPYRFLWKIRLPNKIKVFLWLVLKIEFSLKKNYAKEDGRVCPVVSFVAFLNLLTTYFLSVRWPGTFGKWSK